MNQIPNSKLIHVRFIPRTINVVDDDEADIENTSSLPPAPSVVRKRKMESASTSYFSRSFPDSKRPTTSNGSPSKCYPKRLSVLDMMKLGKIVDSRKTTVVDLYSFDIDLMTWSKVPQTVQFLVEVNPLGQGGFRSAYKATTRHAEFKKCSWVIKKYLPEAAATIEATNHSLEDHNKKVVQMHMRWHATLLFS
jgi:hypothetical protein